MTTTYQISIAQDGVWAGDADVIGGRIEQCGATLGPTVPELADGSQDGDLIYEQSERAIAAIEAALARGKSSVEVDGVRYTWWRTDA